MSRNAENGSHPAAPDAAEGHAGQVDGLGGSGNARIGSYLEMTPVTDAAWVHVSGPGSSEFTKNGSHLAVAPVTDAAGVQFGVQVAAATPEQAHTRQRRTSAMSPGWSCDGDPHRSVQNQAFCCTGWPRRTVRCRKWPCGVREAHLSAGVARGGGNSASRHIERVAGASGSWWRIVVAQVRRKPMMARWLQIRTTQSPIRAVADKCLVMSRIMICPVGFC